MSAVANIAFWFDEYFFQVYFSGKICVWRNCYLVGIKWFEITVTELDTNTSAKKAIYKQLLVKQVRWLYGSNYF